MLVEIGLRGRERVREIEMRVYACTCVYERMGNSDKKAR